MQKRVLVTGAAGFIGFHVAKACINAGYFVTAIDNFNDYYTVSLKEDRAKELQKLGLEVKRIDICDQSALIDLVKTEKITHIVHLAAHAGVRYSLEAPHEYVKTNIDGFVSILEACRTGVKLVYASSAAVYGSNAHPPFAVDAHTDQQLEVYGVTKKTNELFAECYHHLYDIPCTGLRFFTVYGPWGRPDMAYYSFTKAILEGAPIQLYDAGKYRRDFIYVDDVVSAILTALDYKGVGIMNVGSGVSKSVVELVEAIETATGKKANRVYLPSQKTEMPETRADISQALIRPTISFEEGIGRFVSWYTRYFSSSVASP